MSNWIKDAWRKNRYKSLMAFMLSMLVFVIAIGEHQAIIWVLMLTLIYWGMAYIFRNNA